MSGLVSRSALAGGAVVHAEAQGCPVLVKYIGLVILALTLLYGCDTENYDCAIEDRYIAGYDPVTYPSGDVYYETIWECP